MRKYFWMATTHDGFQFTAASGYGVPLSLLMTMPMSIQDVSFIPKDRQSNLPVIKFVPGWHRDFARCEIWMHSFEDMAKMVKMQIFRYGDTRIMIDLDSGVQEVCHA